MKCSTIIYINPDDPRTFVYKHEKYKWLGVTFNFARGRSYAALGLVLLPMPIWLLLLLLNIPILGEPLPTAIIFLLLYFTWICIYCFSGAAKDLARYPGALSKR